MKKELDELISVLDDAVDMQDNGKYHDLLDSSYQDGIFHELRRFLNKQAERVQEFEGWLNASTYNQRMLRKENRRYREAIEEALTEGEYEDVHDQLERIVNTLVEALEGDL